MDSMVADNFDVTFTMLRPLTTRGGPLENIFYLWNIYADVDLHYATWNDIPTMATGRTMIVEIVMNFVAIYLDRVRSPHALITAFTSTVLVFWKTCVFLALYVRVPEGNPPSFAVDASALHIFFVFWVPNCVWIVVPFVAIVAMWRLLVRRQVEEPLVECKVAV